VGLIWLRLLF